MLATEAYLEPCRTYKLNIFCENSYRLVLQKTSIKDIWQGSKYAIEHSIKTSIKGAAP